MLKQIQKIYKKFCQETKRSGGVLVGSSILEWSIYLTKELKPPVIDNSPYCKCGNRHWNGSYSNPKCENCQKEIE